MLMLPASAASLIWVLVFVKAVVDATTHLDLGGFPATPSLPTHHPDICAEIDSQTVVCVTVVMAMSVLCLPLHTGLPMGGSLGSRINPAALGVPIEITPGTGIVMRLVRLFFDFGKACHDLHFGDCIVDWRFRPLAPSRKKRNLPLRECRGA